MAGGGPARTAGNAFKYDWDDGIMIKCADVPELVDTVALGPRYKELYGPLDKQSSAWWERDPWYVYMGEIGMLGG